MALQPRHGADVQCTQPVLWECPCSRSWRHLRTVGSDGLPSSIIAIPDQKATVPLSYEGGMSDHGAGFKGKLWMSDVTEETMTK